MPSASQSPTLSRYLVSLRIPQQLEVRAAETGMALGRAGYLPAPMEPLMPVAEFSRMPVEPVPGLIPGPDEAIRPGDRPVFSGGWWIWPVDGQGWFENLATALTVQDEPRGIPPVLFPLCRGIPLAWDTDGLGGKETTATADSEGAGTGTQRHTEDRHSRGFERLESPDGNKALLGPGTVGWRALVLQCREFRFSESLPPRDALQWQILWTRRLKRGPSAD